MSVSEVMGALPGLQTWERFDGALTTGGAVIGSPTWVSGVEGKALRCAADQGATIVATDEAARGYPLTVHVWVSFTSGALSAPVFQWGTTPSVGMILHGTDSGWPAGTVEFQVRMSNGDYAMRSRIGPLAPGQWHLLSVTISQASLWGGAAVKAYVNGGVAANSSYSGSLFNIVNFNRPTTVTVGVSAGQITVDELGIYESTHTASQVQSLFDAAGDVQIITDDDPMGWGIVF